MLCICICMIYGVDGLVTMARRHQRLGGLGCLFFLSIFFLIHLASEISHRVTCISCFLNDN